MFANTVGLFSYVVRVLYSLQRSYPVPGEVISVLIALRHLFLQVEHPVSARWLIVAGALGRDCAVIGRDCCARL